MDEPDSIRRTVTVFGSGTASEDSEEFRQAERLGRALAERGLVVCNGGYGGTMLAAARAARAAHGSTVGVTLAGSDSSAPNPCIEREIPCSSFVERITVMLETGHGYVVLPGGTGTLAEVGLLFEMMNKLLLPTRPIVLLGPFWLPLLELLRGERILDARRQYTPVEGVNSMGVVACTNLPEAAADFLSLNLLRGDSDGPTVS